MLICTTVRVNDQIRFILSLIHTGQTFKKAIVHHKIWNTSNLITFKLWVDEFSWKLFKPRFLNWQAFGMTIVIIYSTITIITFLWATFEDRQAPAWHDLPLPYLCTSWIKALGSSLNIHGPVYSPSFETHMRLISMRAIKPQNSFSTLLYTLCN